MTTLRVTIKTSPRQKTVQQCPMTKNPDRKTLIIRDQNLELKTSLQHNYQWMMDKSNKRPKIASLNTKLAWMVSMAVTFHWKYCPCQIRVQKQVSRNLWGLLPGGVLGLWWRCCHHSHVAKWSCTQVAYWRAILSRPWIGTIIAWPFFQLCGIFGWNLRSVWGCRRGQPRHFWCTPHHYNRGCAWGYLCIILSWTDPLQVNIGSLKAIHFVQIVCLFGNKQDCCIRWTGWTFTWMEVPISHVHSPE